MVASHGRRVIPRRPSSVKRMDLVARRCWIFDLDGTLTVAVHDFDGIRSALGLPAGEPILEAIARLPEPARTVATTRLDVIELELAGRAVAQEGAAALLAALASRTRALGVLTRNSEANARETLRRAGLDGYFAAPHVVGRESATPKPDAAGVRLLLERLGATPEETVVVGDYRYDLEAGRAAGAATVLVDPSGAFGWASLADACVGSLAELVAVLARVGTDPAA